MGRILKDLLRFDVVGALTRVVDPSPLVAGACAIPAAARHERHGELLGRQSFGALQVEPGARAVLGQGRLSRAIVHRVQLAAFHLDKALNHGLNPMVPRRVLGKSRAESEPTWHP